MQTAVSTLIIYKKRDSDLVKTIEDNLEIKRWEIIDEGFHGLNDYRIKRLKEISSTRKIEFSVHAPFSSINLAEVNLVLRNNFIKILKQSLKRAFKLEAKIWVTHPGKLTPFTYNFPEEARKANSTSLRELCKEAENLGISLTLENMTTQYDLFRSVEDGIKLLNDVENIGFCLDVGHAKISHNLEEFILKLPHIKHLHIHENNGKKDEHLAIGRGNTRWEKIIGRLNRIKYKGWIVTENYELKDALKTLQYISRV